MIALLSCNQQESESISKAKMTDVDTVGLNKVIPEKYKKLWGSGYWDKGEIIAISSYKKITMERTGCYGTCPNYTIELFNDGKIKYTGKEFVEKIGKYEGELYLLFYGKLCYLIDEYFKKYSELNYIASWTDDEACNITLLTKDDKTIQITDYGRQGPIELWAIQKTIDGMLIDIDFTKTQF